MMDGGWWMVDGRQNTMEKIKPVNEGKQRFTNQHRSSNIYHLPSIIHQHELITNKST
jgi:hypothetical protein